MDRYVLLPGSDVQAWLGAVITLAVEMRLWH